MSGCDKVLEEANYFRSFMDAGTNNFSKEEEELRRI